MASGLTKEAGDTSVVGSNRIYSDGRCRKDKCSYGDSLIEDRVSLKKPIHYGCGCYSTRVWTDFGLGLGLEP